MYYAGKDFESAKEYKTLEGAKKAADKNGLNVYDEDAAQIYPEPVADPEEDQQQEEQAAAADEAVQEQEGDQQQEQESDQQQEQAKVKEEDVKGTIRRVFDGKLRLRREPSFDDSAICGVTAFDVKKAVKKFTTPDGVLYQTADGYFVSGRPGDVEFIPE